MSNEQWFAIYFGEDGLEIEAVPDPEAFLGGINEELPDLKASCMPVFLDCWPDDWEEHYPLHARLVIRGKIVVPLVVKVVQEFRWPEN
jgi:hypothetical protein